MRTASAFHPLASAIDLPEAERRRIEWWREHPVRPGTRLVEARVREDVFSRFRTMEGFRVPRRTGWDCHGLPVEPAVEC
ncbi:hypothetical protein E1161_20080 [Saccharopolyspora aridisoli]|uniref:Aminoacyl-tRNA synthetase class Ia domain-containing protein n=1 Tax=Saccharopolyspora aridisoli TaxID=2530385 RepID=A0A4R4UEI3_9PSEU|nr:class I tRNA ligase family protein [Saccharopolyspora aridisoli]TDC90011.1 hypothetical protein E1161_20080 [Saccharopolyspora aridisoli]